MLTISCRLTDKKFYRLPHSMNLEARNSTKSMKWSWFWESLSRGLKASLFEVFFQCFHQTEEVKNSKRRSKWWCSWRWWDASISYTILGNKNFKTFFSKAEMYINGQRFFLLLVTMSQIIAFKPNDFEKAISEHMEVMHCEGYDDEEAST